MAVKLLVLAGAVPATGAIGDNCIGEYVADEFGECVLEANGGDVDEPTATHRSCAAHEFLCPDRATCVGSAKEYAECATGRSFATCDLNGTWACDMGGKDCLVIESADGSSFIVTTPPNPTWSSGSASVLGSNINILYQMKGNGPHGRTGVLDCGSSSTAPTIAWNDSSIWQKQVPLAEPLDVHIIAHTHDDTGYLSTVDEYYESNVRSILTTVTQELQKNPARKFTCE
jgi:hypothetical protein